MESAWSNHETVTNSILVAVFSWEIIHKISKGMFDSIIECLLTFLGCRREILALIGPLSKTEREFKSSLSSSDAAVKKMVARPGGTEESEGGGARMIPTKKSVHLPEFLFPTKTLFQPMASVAIPFKC
jgi:hypothetical protein